MEDTGLRRIALVSKILAEEGLWMVVDKLNLRGHLPFLSRWMNTTKPSDARPERIRRCFEKLGGTYIKLGQLLSLRPDLVPIEYCEEFSKLQDKLPPLPFSEVKKAVEAELGQGISSVFSEFSTEPIGSASIAQVHTAKLASNHKKVVVKLMRPGIEKKFQADLEVMYFLAHRLAKHFAKEGFSPLQIVTEFERYTKEELNFLEEGSHIDKFHRNFVGSRRVVIPGYYKEHSTKRMIVMDLVDGVKLSSIISGVRNHHDRKAIAKNLFDLCIKQVFEMNIFHADMHPGNILVLPDNRVALLDFGITGSLSPELRQKGIRLYVALVDKDMDEIFESILSMGHVTDESKIPQFRQEVRDIVDVWHGEPLSQVRVTHVLHEILNSCVDHGIRLPSNLLLLGKALVTVEGTCMRLYPDFNFVDESKPYLASLMTSSLKSELSLKSVLKKSLALKAYLEKLPRKAAAALDTIERGKVNLTIEAAEVGYLGHVLSVSADRVATALVIAACIISGALILQVNVPPYAGGYPVFALVCFGIGITMTIILLLSFLKQMRMKGK